MHLFASILFLLSLALCFYVLAGYPVLLAVLSRRNPRPVRKDFNYRPTVTILLPVYNGAAWIAAKLESILQLDYPRELLDIRVISDGSTDATDSIVHQLASRGVRLLQIAKSGKAAALNAGLETVRSEVVFFTDVRQTLDPASLRHLVACLADPKVGVASGELFIRRGSSSEEANIGLYWRYEKWIRKRLSAIDSVMGATGCIYAMRSKLAAPMPPETLLDDVHLPMLAFFRGYRVILEEGARAFDDPTSLATEFRRKVRTLAGNYQIIRSFPGLLGPGNRMWIHFVSHKLGRLLLPFALLILAFTAPFLPAPWAVTAVAAQAVFYGIALMDLCIPENSALKRLSSPIRTFVVLMAAACCAASILFRPHAEFWKPAPGESRQNATESRR